MSHDPVEPDPSSTAARVERLLAEAEVLLVTAAEDGGPVTVFAQHVPTGARTPARPASEVTDEGAELVREMRDLVSPARALEAVLADPAASLARHASRGDVVSWAWAETGEERALDALMADLCDLVGVRTRGRLVLACARVALPVARARGERIARTWGLGVFEDNGVDPTADRQLGALEAWIETPTPMAREAMMRVLDDTRQLAVWDDDPGDGWCYVVEVADLALRAVLQTDEGRTVETGRDSSAAWTGPEAARRAVVCSLKVLAGRDDDPVERAVELVTAMRDVLAD